MGSGNPLGEQNGGEAAEFPACSATPSREAKSLRWTLGLGVRNLVHILPPSLICRVAMSLGFLVCSMGRGLRLQENRGEVCVLLRVNLVPHRW